MAKYLITGRQGAGKSIVIKLLQQRGYTAYDTDKLPGVTQLQDKQTGEVIDWPEGTVDWTKYAWNWNKTEFERLLADDETVFIGAVVSNQADFYHLFDKIFVITVSAETLQTRLENHEHASHHLPGEIERILNDHQTKKELFVSDGAEPISGDRPADQIVDDILKKIGL